MIARTLLVLSLLLTLLPTSTASAQAVKLDSLAPAPLVSHAARTTADIVSTGSVVAALAGDTWRSWHAADRKQAFIHQGERMALTIGAAELVKRLVHRERPLGQDHLSFYSEHTALTAAASCTSTSGSFLIPITAMGRILSGWHFLTDTLAGAAAGCAAGLLVR